MCEHCSTLNDTGNTKNFKDQVVLSNETPDSSGLSLLIAKFLKLQKVYIQLLTKGDHIIVAKIASLLIVSNHLTPQAVNGCFQSNSIFHNPTPSRLFFEQKNKVAVSLPCVCRRPYRSRLPHRARRKIHAVCLEDKVELTQRKEVTARSSDLLLDASGDRILLSFPYLSSARHPCTIDHNNRQKQQQRFKKYKYLYI